MKRLLASFKVLTLAAVLAVSAASVTAQTIDGCDDFVHGEDQYGTHWDCFIDGADEDWCYYTCYAF